MNRYPERRISTAALVRLGADVNDLQLAVLATLADADALEEGEILRRLDRSWSIRPTLRALWRRDLIDKAAWWSWQITDAGLIEIGRKPRRAQLTLIAGGRAST